MNIIMRSTLLRAAALLTCAVSPQVCGADTEAACRSEMCRGHAAVTVCSLGCIGTGNDTQNSISIYFQENTSGVLPVYTPPMYTGDAPGCPAEERGRRPAELYWTMGRWDKKRLAVELLCSVRDEGETEMRSYTYEIPVGPVVGKFSPDEEELESSGTSEDDSALHFDKYLADVRMKDGEVAVSPDGKFRWTMRRNARAEQSGQPTTMLVLSDAQGQRSELPCDAIVPGGEWSPDGSYFALLKRHATMQYTIDIYYIQEHRDNAPTLHRVYKTPAYIGDSLEQKEWKMSALIRELYWSIKEWNMDEMSVTLVCELKEEEVDQVYRRYEYKVPIGIPARRSR